MFRNAGLSKTIGVIGGTHSYFVYKLICRGVLSYSTPVQIVYFLFPVNIYQEFIRHHLQIKPLFLSDTNQTCAAQRYSIKPGVEWWSGVMEWCFG